MTVKSPPIYNSNDSPPQPIAVPLSSIVRAPECPEESHNNIRVNRGKFSPTINKEDDNNEDELDNEPLKNLWQFLRNLLHNPQHNPKMIAWQEQLSKGEFKVQNLQDLFGLWRQVKNSPINYDLWVRTVKYYDERDYLHPVSGYRCCYRFGHKATDWMPLPHEITSGRIGLCEK